MTKEDLQTACALLNLVSEHFVSTMPNVVDTLDAASWVEAGIALGRLQNIFLRWTGKFSKQE